MIRIAVLCSTYNGEKYLRRQLDTILAQEEVAVELYVRDDGSTDGTLEILWEYAKKYENVHVFQGENLGYIQSFLWLVFHVPAEDNLYYAFSDQDDVWHPRKLWAAVERIRTEANTDCEPVLYYSDLNVVDEQENFIRTANDWEGTIDRYKIAMFIGVRGCTMVYNSALQKLLLQYRPGRVSSHDTYIAMAAFWLGRVVYDEHPYIDYRQTGGNVSITGVSKMDKLKKNLLYVRKRLTVRANIHEMNAKEILKGYQDISDAIGELREVAYYRESWKNRIALLRGRKWHQFSRRIRWFNVAFIILGKL